MLFSVFQTPRVNWGRTFCGVYSDNFEVKTKDCSAYLNIPNIFTPNNDGINDFLQPITSLNISSLYIQIYNRWGEIVFYSSDINFKWDGTKISNNKLCCHGTYFWTASFSDINSNTQIINGTVTLN